MSADDDLRGAQQTIAELVARFDLFDDDAILAWILDNDHVRGVVDHWIEGSADGIEAHEPVTLQDALELAMDQSHAFDNGWSIAVRFSHHDRAVEVVEYREQLTDELAPRFLASEGGVALHTYLRSLEIVHGARKPSAILSDHFLVDWRSSVDGRHVDVPIFGFMCRHLSHGP